MFQVLLCDDEPSVTQFLKENVPWETLGIRKVYVASNGKEALNFLAETTVDLLITDIRMPHMDGLTLLEQVRTRYPEIHCILLTAYGEFEYARTAFLLGVDNYLLKPIQLSELTATIENTVENIFVKRKNESALFRENILRRWLTGTIGEAELGERTSLLDDINIYQASYCAVCLTKTTSNVSLSVFAEKTRQLLSPEYDCQNVWDNKNHHVLIIGGHSINREQIARCLEMPIDSSCIYAAIGVSVEQCMNLSHSFQSALTCVDSLSTGKETDSHVYIVPMRDSSCLPTPTTLRLPAWESLSPIVQKALNYIHTEYANGVSIKEFCAGHAVTTAYLGYLFKKETGIFFNTYVNNYRLEKAADRLTQTLDKINTIAEKTGFSSPSYFITSFKKYMGVSPQKYRELHEQ